MVFLCQFLGYGYFLFLFCHYPASADFDSSAYHFYVFSVDTTTTGVLFAIWCVLVSSSDAILKPILLSRGSHIPIIVILLGALGEWQCLGLWGYLLVPLY